MNKVVLLGRLAADPELRQTPNGITVTSFTIAVDRQYSKGPDRQTDWIDIVAWRHTAEFVCKYFQKGSPIVIEGSIQTRTYEDKSGQKRKAVEINAKNAEFVPKNAGTNAEGQEASFGARADILTPADENTVQSRTVAQGIAEEFELIEDEDWPF